MINVSPSQQHQEQQKKLIELQQEKRSVGTRPAPQGIDTDGGNEGQAPVDSGKIDGVDV